LKKELEQNIENNLETINELNHVIEQMKKELVEREISNKRYSAKIKTLEKKNKLENTCEKMFRNH